MAKVTMIELEAKNGRQSFPVEQADGILRMRFHGTWHLPEDSEWSWSPEKGFEKKAPKAAKGSKDGANGSNGANGQSEE
jgi:hypothetical protein